ncbi:MAG: GerAB/ArcD/ProY family transporter [Clostridia bacterium]
MKVEPISLGQFFLMVAVTVVAGGVYVWPSAVLADAGSGALWAILLSIGVALGLVYLQTLWPPAFSGPTQLARSAHVWGWMRWPLFLVTLAIYLALDTALVALFSHMLHVVFYPRTPYVVFRMTILLVVGWMATHSVSWMARNVQFWFPLLIASFFALVILALPNMAYLGAVRPAEITAWGPFGRALVSTWYLWVQGEVILTLGIHVRSQNWGQIRRTALLAIGFQGTMLLVIYVLVVATLGLEAPIVLQWPLVYLFSNLEASVLFVSRPGLIIMITWVIALILYTSVTLMVLTTNLQEALRLSNRARRVMVWIGVLILALLGSQISSPLTANTWILEGVNPVALGLTLFTSVGAPIMLYVRRRARGKA